MSACAQGAATTTMPTAAAAATIEQSQSPAQTIQSFTAVEGTDLNARLEAASVRARSKQTPYWSAYAFDVRPGVAVDPNIHQFNGSMNTYGDTTVFTGTTANGMTIETRNLAIFLLRTPGSNQVTRMEIYNLERRREYGGYPVYWLDRANNEESLNYLRSLADAAPASLLAERAVLAISLHDDNHVGSMLKNFIRTSQNRRIRLSAVYWLGQVGGEQAFLADLVRNEAEDRDLRKRAAYALGESRDRSALATLQTLYDTVTDREVRRSIVHAAGENEDRDAALAFVLKVAKTDADRENRRAAVHQLGEFEGERVVDELMKIYASDADIEVKRAVLHALAETKSSRAQVRLLEVARTDASPELRRDAIHMLGERGEAVVEDLIKLYDTEQNTEVRRTVLHALAEIKGQRAEDKLFEIARNDASTDLRRQAINVLGERASARSLDFLSATAQSTDGNTEVQMQAVRAISERSADEAVPILIKIAKTHPNQLVRRQAIRALGESGDPRAVEFFREVLAK
ncbi:MAG TPA: HEAT repeat domain-containing protein [Pyrinomonadaceae bacterium]|nr:HEAT repeat domain-containing protein [Pyrinomonadaceae bacterium]